MRFRPIPSILFGLFLGTSVAPSKELLLHYAKKQHDITILDQASNKTIQKETVKENSAEFNLGLGDTYFWMKEGDHEIYYDFKKARIYNLNSKEGLRSGKSVFSAIDYRTTEFSSRSKMSRIIQASQNSTNIFEPFGAEMLLGIRSPKPELQSHLEFVNGDPKGFLFNKKKIAHYRLSTVPLPDSSTKMLFTRKFKNKFPPKATFLSISNMNFSSDLSTLFGSNCLSKRPKNSSTPPNLFHRKNMRTILVPSPHFFRIF
jgi:hypothetical protein